MKLLPICLSLLSLWLSFDPAKSAVTKHAKEINQTPAEDREYLHMFMKKMKQQPFPPSFNPLPPNLQTVPVFVPVEYNPPPYEPPSSTAPPPYAPPPYQLPPYAPAPYAPMLVYYPQPSC